MQISASWSMVQRGTLALEYRVDDPHDHALWPISPRGRADGLWQHSCFEAFVAQGDGAAYAEFNVSPSGAWAAYAFDDYRAGMRDLELANPPAVDQTTQGIWHVSLDLCGLDALLGARPWRLALTAVIEARDGSTSLWSLRHPPAKPDFHHADCFAARLA